MGITHLADYILMKRTLASLTVGPKFGVHGFGGCCERELENQQLSESEVRSNHVQALTGQTYMLLIHFWRPSFRPAILTDCGV